MPPASTPDKRPPAEAYRGEAVQIEVEGGKVYKVHKGVLCFWSKYFEKCLEGNFSEAESGVVKLAEDGQVFDHFVSWLYTYQVPDLAEKEDYFGMYCCLWIVADRRETPALANTCIDVLRDKLVAGLILPKYGLDIVYEMTTPGSELRRIMIQILAKTDSALMFQDEQCDRWPREALWDFAKVLLAGRALPFGAAVVKQWDLCEFHQHEEGVKCPRGQDSKQ